MVAEAVMKFEVLISHVGKTTLLDVIRCQQPRISLRPMNWFGGIWKARSQLEWPHP